MAKPAMANMPTIITATIIFFISFFLSVFINFTHFLSGALLIAVSHGQAGDGEYSDHQNSNDYILHFSAPFSLYYFYLFPSATTVPPVTLLGLSVIIIGKQK
jgi:hypothetical protein